MYVLYMCSVFVRWLLLRLWRLFLGSSRMFISLYYKKKTICTFISHLQYFIVSFSFCFILNLYCECLLLFAVFRFLSNLSVFNLIFVFRMHFCLRICSLKIHLILKNLFYTFRISVVESSFLLLEKSFSWFRLTSRKEILRY